MTKDMLMTIDVVMRTAPMMIVGFVAGQLFKQGAMNFPLLIGAFCMSIVTSLLMALVAVAASNIYRWNRQRRARRWDKPLTKVKS